MAALREVVRQARERQPFVIDAWVVLPDHIHAVWTLPPGDHDYPTRWNRIKAGFSRIMGPRLNVPESNTPGRLRERRTTIWQRRYWEHCIREEDDFHAHVDYIHFNPVKHGLVAKPSDWPFSTFHRYVAQGLYPPEWGRDEISLPDSSGSE